MANRPAEAVRTFLAIVARACVQGLIAYLFPRLLIAGGVPLDKWIITVGSLFPAGMAITSSPEAIGLISAVIFIVLWIVEIRWQLVQRIFEKLSRQPASLDNTIEFEWSIAPREVVVPDDGRVHVMPLIPVPPETMGGGPAAITTAPGSKYSLGPAYRCRVINHGPDAIFDARCEIQTTFFKNIIVEDTQTSMTQGEMLFTRTWVTRVDPKAGSFTFYLQNPNDVWIRITAPITIEFQRIGSDKRETASLIRPRPPEVMFSPPMPGFDFPKERKSRSVTG